jgi:DNA-binding transcriptional regulator YiaG
MVTSANREELLAALEAARAVEAELLESGSREAVSRIQQVRGCLERLSYGTLTPDEFKRLRKQAGLTQEDLARILNRRLRQVGRYERGDTPVPGEVGATLRDLAGGK